MRRSSRVLSASSILAALAFSGGILFACVGDDPVVGSSPSDDAGDGSSTAADSAANSDGSPIGAGDSGDAGVDSDAVPPATGTVIFAVTVTADLIFGNSVAFDGLGNVFLGGQYKSTTAVDFGNGKSLAANAPVNGGATDGFIAKFDATGKCLWVSPLVGSHENNVGVFMVAAAPNGEVVFTADTGGVATVKLDKATVAGNGGNDIALGRLNASGSQVFLRTLASPGYEFGTAVAVDSKGRIALAGRYIRDTATDVAFDGITANPPVRPNSAAFVAILNAQGVTQSLKAFPYTDNGASSVIQADDLKFSPDGNVVVGGQFTGTIDLRNGEAASQFETSTAAGGDDAWIAKIDTTTNKTIWGTAFGGTGSDSINGIAVDPSGNVSALFNYGSAINIGGTAPLPAPGGNIDIGLVRFDGNGGMPSAVSYGSAGSDVPVKLAVDRWGEPILVGFMNGAISFGGKVANISGAAGGVDDGFIAKLSPTGAGLWAYGIGGPGNEDEINSVDVDHQGNVACTGKLGGAGDPITLFGKTVNVGPGKSATFLTVTKP